MTEAPRKPAEHQVVILAGGLGTRARALTGDAPKALVPVGSKPFAHHQLSLLASQGVTRVLYCIGHGGDQLRRFVADGSEWGLEVSYIDEGAELRGTGGALRTALDAGALKATFAVLYGDSYLPIELEPVWEAFAAAQQPALMTVLRNEDRWDRSNVVFEDGLVVVYDKSSAERDPRMAWIDYGLTLLDRDVVREHLPSSQTLDLSALYGVLSRERRLAGFEVTQPFYEVGSPDGIADLERFLAGQAARAS